MYLAVIFVVFKPSIAQDTSADYLTTIIKENFEQEASWKTFIEVPLFVESDPIGNRKISVTYPFLHPLENTTVLLNGYPIAFSITSGNPGDLYIDINLDGGKKVLEILQSEVLYARVDPSYDPLGGLETFDSQYGISESLHGYSSSRLESMENYQTMKLRWHYPPYREFSVNITDSLTDEQLYFFGSLEKPRAQADILEWSDFLIEDTGNEIPITIRVKTW